MYDLDSLPFVVPVESVKPLVFKERKILLTDIGFSKNRFYSGPDDLRRPFLETEPVINNQSRSDGWQPFSGKITDEHIVFPSDGQYIILCDIGVRKILIVSDSKKEEEILQIAGFLSKNIIHHGSDVKKGTFEEALEEAIYYPNLYKKLFYSDQPLGLICGTSSLVSCSLFSHLGFRTRHIWIYNSSTRNGHICMEVFNEEKEEWIFFDPDYGCVLKSSNGSILSAEEMIRGCRSGETDRIETIDLAGKSLPLGKLQHTFGFDGALNWAPSMLQGPESPMLKSDDYCKDISRMTNGLDTIRALEIETNYSGITRIIGN